MIFCGNRESDKDSKVDNTLMDSLFSFASDELRVSSSIPSSLLFISGVLTERAPDVNWQSFLTREFRNILEETIEE